MNRGKCVFAAAAIALGVIGLVWADFASIWQPIAALPFELPYRAVFADAVAVLLILGGAAMLWQRTARAGAIVLGVLYFLFALLWLPRVIGFPLLFGTWAGFFQELALASAAIVAYASFAPRGSAPASTAGRFGRIAFGICVMSFAAAHFTALSATAAMVPKWMPPGQFFWAAATGAAFALAGIAIITGLLAVLAGRLLTAMLLVFGAAIWLPALVAHPGDHIVWAGNAFNLASAAAAWVVADWMKLLGSR
jgi:hypothetical protein